MIIKEWFQAGSVLVETVLVTGFLVFLLSGAVGYNQALNEQGTLIGAARAGARAGARYGPAVGAVLDADTLRAEIKAHAMAMAAAYIEGAGYESETYVTAVDFDCELLPEQDRKVSRVSVTVTAKPLQHPAAGKLGLLLRAAAVSRIEGDFNPGEC